MVILRYAGEPSVNTCVAKRESGVKDGTTETEVRTWAQAPRATLETPAGPPTSSDSVISLCGTAGLWGWAVTSPHMKP